MALIAEFHLLQNFAPSNLNRDDTGAPKDAVFGGVRRARISSQCVKRAVRLHFARTGLLTTKDLASRTKRIQGRLAKLLREAHGRAEDDSTLARACASALGALGLKVKDRKDEAFGHTEYLLFLGEQEIVGLAAAVNQYFDDFLKGKPGKAAKDAVEGCIGSARAVDVALFGRMLADRKDFNVDAAAQVAHAISTHRVDRDVDFFTAVDDFATDAEAESGMLGTVEFNASCFYRYAVVNLELLRTNLGDLDGSLTVPALQALLRGLVEAVPSGKQNTFAAHNPPDFVAVTVRQGAPMNLANAFEKPVLPSEADGGLTAASVRRLQSRWNTYGQTYGVDTDGLQVLDLTGQWSGAGVRTLDGLVEGMVAAYTARAAG
jgi:CRISPR system Cascade subunit CasC